MDTNIVISGLLFGGRASEVIALLRRHKISLLVSREIIDEYIRALSYPKFRLSKDEIKALMAENIFPFCKTVSAPGLDKPVCRDEEDDKFIACAIAGNARVIVSGDKDLLAVGSYKGIPITGLNAFLKRFD